ncbi:hypothetical protein BYT27DRAFT_7264662 [Phlegmacium glaucopus]|nr:hypothetical protein BYT27DRAFT_7264662 [Phlegmacium glaucopus]
MYLSGFASVDMDLPQNLNPFVYPFNPNVPNVVRLDKTRIESRVFAVALPHAQQLAAEASKSSLGKSTADEEKNSLSDVHAGKTYPFHLALSNLLYDPIQVRLSVQRMHVSTVLPTEGGSPEKARRTPSAVSLLTSSSTVAAFAEVWEYEDDEDMFNVDGGVGQGGRSLMQKVVPTLSAF